MSAKAFRRAALWLAVAIVAVIVLALWHPWAPNNAHTFNTPKGNYVVRLDKSGKPTAFIPDSEARQNRVQLLVTFNNNVHKTCNGDCPIDAPVTQVEARYNGKIIATWP